MKNRARVELCFALLFLSSACVEEAPTSGVPEQIIPTAITATDRDLAPGESTTLTVTITNTLDQAVQLTFPTSCQAQIFIRNTSGQITTPSGGHNCAQVPSSFSLGVGASRTFAAEWGGGVEFGPAGSSARVPPGSYYASAEMRADGYIALAFPILIVVH